MKQHFLSIADWSAAELKEILDLCKKAKTHPERYAEALHGSSIALVFEKQSLRTHVTFDVGVYQLGAHPIYLTQADISLGKRESIYDTAKNLERWVDAVVVRTFAHETCVNLASAINIPVVNALTDYEHPCQAVGDFLTISEKLGAVKNKKFVFVGDGNNVCHSLMLMAAKMGMNFFAVTPRGYEPSQQIFKIASSAAKEHGTIVELSHNPKTAFENADAVYTDVWTSMGQEAEAQQRQEDFKNFRVNAQLMSYAKSDALFMHCLPAHRGQEVTDDVMDSPNSVVFDQAENRLHSAKAVLLTLMRGD